MEDISFEMGESPLSANTDWIENDAVNILTVHSSKGLEFPVVFLVNLVQQRFPTAERREKIPIPDTLIKEILPEGDYHEQEERRLFYVGMTRAKDRLLFTAANYYGEGKRERKISPFVGEALGRDEKEIFKKESGQRVKQLSFMDFRRREEPLTQVIRKIPEYLSYTQFDAFAICPLQYKYRYVLKIPVPTSPAGSFGTSVHGALERFYNLVKENFQPTKDDLLRLLDDEWIPVGYKNRRFEERMRQRGRDMLSRYFDTYHTKATVPLMLEQVFRIKISPALTIGGKIDRIDGLASDKWEIIDYKTGKRPSDREIARSLQMSVYAMAASDPNLYGKKVEDISLTFFFLEQGEKVTSQRTKEQISTVKKELAEKAKEIGTSDFPPRIGPWCKFCDFKLICQALR